MRNARPNLCYPIFVDQDGRIAGAGEPFEGDDESQRPTHDGEFELAWPVRSDGKLDIWRVDATRLRKMFPLGYVVTSKRDPRRGTWSARYLLDGVVQAIERGDLGEAIVEGHKSRRVVPKTMWHRARHAAGATGGTNMLTALLGKGGVFSYPKSVYAVRDPIDAAVGDRREALVLDFFAGSGTALHATALLNALDGGHRRCVLVTNNEVNHSVASRLHRKGHFRGDPEFEANGVYEQVTKPRVTAALTGRRPDAQPAKGAYLDGRPYADGFEENVSFFRLDYLDPDEVEFGMRFKELHPLLWLWAGSIGEMEEIDPTKPLGAPKGSPYAVLFDPSGMPSLLGHLEERDDISHVFIVAESDDAFEQLASDLAAYKVEAICLYRDYLTPLRQVNR